MEPSSAPFSIDVRRLRILREFDRRGTVAATAAALHLTPSAVSQQISVLAREVGVPLLQRRGRGVVLTGQARLLLGHADAIAAQLERARDDLLAYDSGQRGSVTVGSFSSAISGLLPTALTSLRAERPHLRLAVVEAEPPGLFTHLDTGEIDVAIAVDFAAAPPRTDRRYHRYPLMVDVLDLALPAGHRAATGAPVHLSELAEEPWWSEQLPAAAARSHGRCAPRPASPPTSATGSTTGRPSPPSSPPAPASRSSPAWCRPRATPA